MRISRSPFALALALVGVVGVSSSAFARPVPALAGGPLGDGLPTGAAAALVLEAFASLDLSADQRAEIRRVLADHRDELVGGLQAVRTTRSEMFDVIHAAQFDETAVRNQALLVADAEADLAVTRARLVQDLRSVLTLEQQARLKTMRKTAKMVVETILDGMIARAQAFLGS